MNRTFIVFPECEGFDAVYNPVIKERELQCRHIVQFWRDGELQTEVWSYNRIRAWFIRTERELPEHFQDDSDSE